MVSAGGRKSTVTCRKVDKSIGHLIHDSLAVDLLHVRTLRAAAFVSTVQPWRCAFLWEPQAPFRLNLLPFCHWFEVGVLQMICRCLSEHLVKAMAWKIMQRGGYFFYAGFLSFKHSVFLTFGLGEHLSNCSQFNNHLLCLNTTFRQLCSSCTPSLDSYLHRQEIHCLLSLAASPPGFGWRWELITSGDTFLSDMEQVLLYLTFWKTAEQSCRRVDVVCDVFLFCFLNGVGEQKWPGCTVKKYHGS